MSAVKMLMIDKDAAWAGTLSGDLKRRGIAPVHVDSYDEGLSKGISLKPDLIVLDVTGTDGQGWVAFTRYRKVAALASTCIIITGAAVDPKTFDEHRRLARHAEGYLQKPYRLDDLIAALPAALKARFTPGKAAASDESLLDELDDLLDDVPGAEGMRSAKDDEADLSELDRMLGVAPKTTAKAATPPPLPPMPPLPKEAAKPKAATPPPLPPRAKTPPVVAPVAMPVASPSTADMNSLFDDLPTTGDVDDLEAALDSAFENELPELSPLESQMTPIKPAAPAPMKAPAPVAAPKADPPQPVRYEPAPATPAKAASAPNTPALLDDLDDLSLGDSARSLDTLTREIEAAGHARKEKEARDAQNLAEQKARLAALEGENDSLKARLNELENSLRKSQELARLKTEESATTGKRLNDSEAQAREAAEEVERLRKKIASQEQSLTQKLKADFQAELSALREQSTMQLAERDESLTRQGALLARREEDLAALHARLDALGNEHATAVEALKQQLAQERRQAAERLSAREEELQAELLQRDRQFEAQLADSELATDNERSKVATLTRQMESAESRVAALVQERDTLRQRIAEAQEALAALGRESEAREAAGRDELQRLQAHLAEVERTRDEAAAEATRHLTASEQERERLQAALDEARQVQQKTAEEAEAKIFELQDANEKLVELNRQNEERLFKAYRKIKADAELRARSEKALASALEMVRTTKET